MSTEPNSIVSADTPISDPASDELGYAPFAKGLARAIEEMIAPQGNVIALNGEWGLGKSSIIGFTLHYLRQNPPEQQPIIFEFSPWMFSGHEDLARRFFGQLLAVLESDPNEKRKQKIKKVASTLRRK
jgi:predicted KAP-like P-loop ATPase